MEIRELTPQELPEASSIIIGGFLQFDREGASPEGLTEFTRMMEPRSLRAMTVDGSLCLYGLFPPGGGLAGVLGVRQERHIVLLFVRAEDQGKGYGERLIHDLQERCLALNPEELTLTVNASPHAVTYYARFGFLPLGEKMLIGGLPMVPMAWRVK